MTHTQKSGGFRVEARGTPDTVRDILGDLRQHLSGLGLSQDSCGTVEIVMAEALNNIVEHAYAPHWEGPLWLSGALKDGVLTLNTRDTGHPMPGLDVPQGSLPDASGPLDTLPEGGFGWYLIHDLTESLSYRHEDGENRLTLTFAINDSDQG